MGRGESKRGGGRGRVMQVRAWKTKKNMCFCVLKVLKNTIESIEGRVFACVIVKHVHKVQECNITVSSHVCDVSA